MSLKTANAYGKISVTDEAVAMVASAVALDCYGVCELVSRTFTDSIAELFSKHSHSKGVKVVTEGNKIYITIYAILKYGVSKEAVTESLKSAVRYNVESFTGMIVKDVKVSVVGMKL